MSKRRIRVAEELAVDTRVQYLRDLQDLVNFEVPDSFTKEVGIRESSDQSTATFYLAWYKHENNDPDARTIDARQIIDDLAERIFADSDISYEVSHDRKARNLTQSTVTAKFTTTASVRRAQEIVPPATYPFSVYIGDDVFGIDSDNGVTYRITQNGEILGDNYESPADAAGALVGVMFYGLADLEAESGRDDPDAFEQDFMLGLSDFILTNERISIEAKEHYIAFVELVTNRDVAAVLEEQSEKL
jgi:hypothetical protein